ncbi:cytochrome c-type biogenesis protein [Algihabitans albus]|uniref:cytochrome c-type biogenesis protein n=1 Tax=Algihabitans albus TaxID=2164067 RepID=UPI002286E83B|nr:cytochrome c-type biogenesis protein [Algihabitans albus]
MMRELFAVRNAGRDIAGTLREIFGRTVGGLAAAVVALLLVSPVSALMPDEILNDPALEARARALSKDLRCVVCQNESIDSSNAEIARQMRLVVRERLVAGDGDGQVLSYLQARYGDYVLMKPPIKPETYLLWYGPAVVLVLGAIGAGVYLLRRPKAAEVAEPLTAAERARLNRLLNKDDA